MPSNTASLTRLLIEERPSLLRLVSRIAGSLPGAEDVTQALWFKIQKVEDEPPILNPRAYLYRLASNLAVDQVRAEKRRAALFAEGQSETEAPLVSAEKALIDRENLRILGQAIEELSPQCREIFRLSKLEGLPLEVIAKRMGLSRSMVCKHLRTALLHCDARLNAVPEE